jgi:hypothetical protein
MEWTGSDYAAVIAATAAAVVSVGAFVMSAWNNKIARSTHVLVNSNMTEFKAALVAAGILKEEAAEATGALRGQREEKADQALRDKMPTMPPATAPTPPTIELEGTISGSVETKK